MLATITPTNWPLVNPPTEAEVPVGVGSSVVVGIAVVESDGNGELEVVTGGVLLPVVDVVGTDVVTDVVVDGSEVGAGELAVPVSEGGVVESVDVVVESVVDVGIAVGVVDVVVGGKGATVEEAVAESGGSWMDAGYVEPP